MTRDSKLFITDSGCHMNIERVTCGHFKVRIDVIGLAIDVHDKSAQDRFDNRYSHMEISSRFDHVGYCCGLSMAGLCGHCGDCDDRITNGQCDL